MEYPGDIRVASNEAELRLLMWAAFLFHRYDIDLQIVSYMQV